MLTKGSFPHSHRHFLCGTLIILLTLFVKEGQGLKCYLGSNTDDPSGSEDCKSLGQGGTYPSCKNSDVAPRDHCIKYTVKGVKGTSRTCACSIGLNKKHVLDECRVTEDEGGTNETVACICDKDLCNSGAVVKPKVLPVISCYVGFGFVDNSIIREERKRCSGKLEDLEIHSSCKEDHGHGHEKLTTRRRDYCITFTFGEAMFGKQCGCSEGLGKDLTSMTNRTCFGNATEACGCHTKDFCNAQFGSDGGNRKIGGTAATLHFHFSPGAVFISIILSSLLSYSF